MKILAIETSCDETAAAVLETKGRQFEILSNVVSSQIKLHSVFGGVVPNLAKREHQKNLVPVLQKALRKAELLKSLKPQLKTKNKLKTILEREPILLEQTLKFLEKYQKPNIDLIAVTQGPGLEPALWVGINFAKALATAWNKPLIGINHMEGHLASVLLKQNRGISKSIRRGELISKQILNPTSKIPIIQFPAIALLVSGGHTELVLIKDWLKYKVIGQTRDDAAGEAFDKVARILGLGYPGGPAIAAVASLRLSDSRINARLPRPMLNSKDYDFSFSGLKTAVLYLVQDLKKKSPRGLSSGQVSAIAREFQQAAIDVLISKTISAAKQYKAQTIILAGGVAANKELRKQMKKTICRLSDSRLYIPEIKFTGDNAAMISLAAYFQARKNPPRKNSCRKIRADGNLTL